MTNEPVPLTLADFGGTVVLVHGYFGSRLFRLKDNESFEMGKRGARKRGRASWSSSQSATDSWSEVTSDDWDGESDSGEPPNLNDDSDRESGSVDIPDADPDPDSTDERDDEQCPQNVLIDFLVTLLLMRVLTAKRFCTLMYYAGLCGLHKLKELGLNPSSSSGHFARELVRKLGLYTRTDLYELKSAGRTKKGRGRISTTTQVYNLHEILHADLDEHSRADLDKKLNERKTNGDLPDVYLNHPIVQEHGAAMPVYPVAMFADAVPYAHNDSLIGWWIVNLLDPAKGYFICALRKALVCKCGCKGWCSLWPIFSWLAWQFDILKTGIMPSCKHDGTPWGPGDVGRALLGGILLPFRIALCFIKGDWAEYSGTWGFPMWTSALRPCYKCNAAVDNLYETDGISPVSCGQFTETKAEDYHRACDSCEQVFVLSKETHSLLSVLLRYDKRDDGNRGRCLIKHPSLAGLGLRAGLRLEPSSGLTNVGDFENISVFPYPVVFWSVRDESLTRHRNPMFQDHLGVSVRTLTVDTLHTLYLGIINSFCCFVLWRILLGRFWAKGTTIDELVLDSLTVCRNRLHAWHQQRRRRLPKEDLTIPHDLTRGMIGTQGEQKLKTKGSETWTMLLFLLNELHRFPRLANQQRLVRAGEALGEMIRCWQKASWKLKVGEIQQSFDCFNRFLTHTSAIEEFRAECFQPKRHLTIHLLRELDYNGCPRFYATWLDEALNKLLKGCCRNLSQNRFDAAILPAMRHLLVKQAAL